MTITETLRRLTEKAIRTQTQYRGFEVMSLHLKAARLELANACTPQTILALVTAVEAAKTVDACWGVGTRDPAMLVKHLTDYMADLHAALEALAGVEG